MMRKGLDPTGATDRTSASPDGSSTVERPPDREDEVRAAARNLLDRTFGSLSEAHVVPRSRFSPWIRMARDYYGDMVLGGAPLDAALRRGWPERFDLKPGDAGLEFASIYESALIEDAVCAATRNGEPYATSSPAIAEAIERLIARLASARPLRVANVIADLGTMNSEPLEVGGVRIVAVPGGAERLLEREIPGSGFLLEREDAISLGGGDTSVAISDEAVAVDDEAGGESFEIVTARARERIRRLITAVRLGTGTTARPMADVSGEPDTFHLIGPQVYPLRHGGRLMFVHRSVTIGQTEITWIGSIMSVLEASAQSPLPSPIVALGRLNRVLDEPGRILSDQAIDLAIGLEAALAGTRSESEISLRIRNRAAAFLAAPDDPPSDVYGDVKLLYSLRSAFVHGSSMTTDDVWKLIGKVSTALATTWRGEQFELALDRWRDLLRRAILFRLALGATDKPLWPFAKDQSDIDGAITDPGETARWRQTAASFWADRGLPSALSRVGPLQGVLSVSGGPDSHSATATV